MVCTHCSHSFNLKTIVLIIGLSERIFDMSTNQTKSSEKSSGSKIHKYHRIRIKERFLREGLVSFETHNILELLLFYTIPVRDTNVLAHELLNEFGSLHGVFDAPYEELCKIKGISEHTATLIKLIPQLFQRYMDSKLQPGAVYDTTEKRAQFLVPKYIGRTIEILLVVALDEENHITAWQILDEGNFNQVPVITSMIIQFTMKHQSYRILLSHNHPQGMATPSREDRYLTQSLKKTFIEIGIILEDHIIIGKNLDYYSLKEHGMMDYFAG